VSARRKSPSHMEYQRKVQSKHRKRHLEACRQRDRDKWASDPDRRSKKRIADKRRLEQLRVKHFFLWRAKCWNSTYGADLTAGELASLWKKQRGLCALTGTKLSRNAELDHVIPKSRPESTHTIENIRWTNRIPNRMRNNMSDQEFTTWCAAVISWMARGEEQCR